MAEWPVRGQKAPAYWDDMLRNYIDEGDAGGGEGGGALGTEVHLSTFAGATDDDKLTAAMAAVNALTLRGVTIVLDENRDYTFTVGNRNLFNGLSIRGTHRPQDQARTSRPIGNRILLRFATPMPWFVVSASSIFGVNLQNMSIDGNANTMGLIGGSESTGRVLWTTVLRDISVQNASTVLGQPGNRLLVTACTIDGWWNVNNVQSRAWNVGGSDFYFQPSMFLLDSPPELLPATEYLATMEFMSNSWWDNIYCTAEGHSAMLLSGSNTSSISNWLRACVIEGRNAGAPSPGALVRMSGGQWIMRDCRLAFAMTNPSATGRNDGGVIHVSGGRLLVDGCTYQRATGVAETVPFIKITGGFVTVRNIQPIGMWTGKPVVYAADPSMVDADNSVTVQYPVIPVAADSASGFADTGSVLTVNKPANVANGDVLVATTVQRNGTAAYTVPPTGWVERVPTTDSTAAGVVRVWTKVITDAPAEPASYTWSGGGSSGRHAGVVFRARNVNTANPVNVIGAVATLIGGPDRVIAPAVATSADNTLLVAVAQGSSTTGPMSFTNAQGMTVVASANAGTTSHTGLTAFVQAVAATGTTGTRSLASVNTSTTSTGSGYMLALNPA